MKRNFMHRKFIFLPYGWKSILPSVCSKKSNIFMFRTRTRTKTSNISNSNVELERVRPNSGLDQLKKLLTLELDRITTPGKLTDLNVEKFKSGTSE